MLCRNKEKWPHTHTHQTIEEARRCWLGNQNPTAPIVASAPVPPPQPEPQVVVSASFVDPVSPGQINYIRDLHGDVTYARKLSYMEAHEYINKLKAERYSQRTPRVADPRLKILDGMIDMVPDGYYATPPVERDKIDFIRVSRPTKGKFIGSIKVQTKHAELWKEAAVRWPSGNWSIYRGDIIDALFLVIADTQTCRIRYSIEVQACHHCNTGLTDARSRHYLIGPVCEKKYNLQWAIDEVDDKNNGMSFEALVARGLPTRVWQDKELAAL